MVVNAGTIGVYPGVSDLSVAFVQNVVNRLLGSGVDGVAANVDDDWWCG